MACSNPADGIDVRSVFVFLFFVGSELCDMLVAGSEEFYHLCVLVCWCDLETSTSTLPMPYFVFCTTDEE